MALQVSYLTSAVGSTNPRISFGFGIRIDGVEYTSRFSGDYSYAHDAMVAFATGTFPVEVPFELAIGKHIIELYEGWQNDFHLAFKGEIIQRGKAFWRRTDTLEAAGVLRRTQVGLNAAKAFYNVGGDESDLLDQIPDGYTPIPISTDADIIVHILESYGILPGAWGHSIEADYTWSPALLSPILWDADTAGWPIIERLDRQVYRTFDSRIGAVFRRLVIGQIPSGVRYTFTDGIDILDVGTTTVYEPYNQVVVRGAQIPSMIGVIDAQPDELQVLGYAPTGTPEPSPYIDDPPGIRSYPYDNPYIETVPDAELLASRLLGFLQEPAKETPLTALACPDFDVANGLGLDSDILGEDFDAFIITHARSGGQLKPTSQFMLRGSSDATVIGNLDPVALFTVQTVLNAVRIAGTLTQVVMVTVDARASHDPDGTIASWSISVGGTVTTGSDTSQAVATILWTGSTAVPVSVTVTDDDGATDTLVRDEPYDITTMPREPLVAAETTQAEASIDGLWTWNTQTGTDALAVAPIALGDRTLFFGAAGQVWRSTDYLATASTLLATIAGTPQINCAWNHEQITTRWLAGAQSGGVSLSSDSGATWALLATLAAAVNDISESPATTNQMSAAAGESLWTTFDGRNWSALITTSGATCLRFAAGAYGGVSYVYAGFSTGVIKMWRSDTGAVSTITTLAGKAIRGLTLNVDLHEVYIFTDSVSTYSYTPAGGVVAGPNVTGAVNYAIRSGLGRGQWVYIIGATFIGKWMKSGYYDVRLITGGLRIGYGAARVTGVGGTPALPPPTPPVVTTETRVVSSSAAKAQGHGSTPAGWETYAFVDSGWPAAVANLGFGGAPIGAAALSRNTAGTSFTNEQNIIRQHFTLPAGTVVPTGNPSAVIVDAWIRVVTEDYADDVYINGHRLGDAIVGYTEGSAVTNKIFNITAAQLVLGGDNVIAIRFHNSGGNYIWTAFEFEVVTSATPGGTPTTAFPATTGAKLPSVAVGSAQSYVTWGETAAVKFAEGTLAVAPVLTSASTVGSVGSNAGYFNTSVTVDSGNTLHAAWIQDGARLYHRSKAAGGSWSAVHTIIVEESFANGCSIAASNATDLAVLWRGANGEIFYSRSSDGGVSWSARGTVSGATAYAGVVQLVPNNRDYAAWGSSAGNIQAGTGSTYTVETVATGGSGDAFLAQPTMARHTDGTLWVAYRRVGGNILASFKSGGTWTQETVKSGDVGVGTVALALDSSGVPTVVWSTGTAVYRSTRTGVNTWSAAAAVTIGSGTYKTNLDLAIDASGNKHIVIEDWSSSGASTIKYTRV